MCNSRTTILLITLLLGVGVLGLGSARASGDFGWLASPDGMRADTLTLTLGAGNYQAAPFPHSGLRGDLTDIGVISLRAGAGDNVDLRARGSVRRILKTADSTTSATGDFSIETRWRILARPTYSFGLLLGMTLPNTNVRSGLGLDQGAQYGRALLAFHRADVALVLNAGVAIMNDPTIPTGQDDFFTFGLGISAPISKTVDIAGEFYGVDGPDDGPEDGLFDSLAVALNTTFYTEPLFFTVRAAKYLADVAPHYSIAFAIGTHFRFRDR